MARNAPARTKVRSHARPVIGALVCGALVACSSNDDHAAPTDSGTDTATLAADAFVWGFPVVVTRRYFQFLGQLALNKLFNQTALSTAAIRVVVSPNQDTLYSIAVLDLRSEPMVLTVPDVLDRYWTYQFLDGWTNSFHYIGTRATAGKGGSFAVTPPGFTGTLPPGVTEVKSPTPVLLLLGRYLVKDNTDAANVTALSRTLAPLSTLTGAPAPPAPPPLGATLGSPRDTGSTGAPFFDELGDALALDGPVSADDTAALKRFQPLGIGPGLHPVASSDASVPSALEAGAAAGLARIDGGITQTGIEKNGWQTLLDIGTYTNNFLTRAIVAKFAWAANVPEEAIYAASTADATGQAYDGNRPYTMHFDKTTLPPVDPSFGFWSVTLYGTDNFFAENSIQRYAIGDRTQGLTYNADGSLDVYIQNTAPIGKEGNWLPSPLAPFLLIMRLYLPTQTVQDGNYAVPPVVAQ